MKHTITGCLLCVLLLASGVRADQLVLDNGSILIGKLVSASAAVIVFNTPFAGDINVDQARIVSILTEDDTVDVLLKDGTLLRDRSILTQGSALVISGEPERQPLSVSDINMLNPEPWRVGLGYKWSGRFNASLESERGNADSDEIDLDMRSVWDGQLNRYTLSGVWDIDESNNVRNKNSWLVRGKYDRFRSDARKNYAGFQIAQEHAEFQDLDRRTSLGPYLGRQFYDDAMLQVQGEVGAVYVDEEFYEASDRDFWGVNWELRAESEPVEGFQFYASQVGIIDLNKLDEFIANTTVGLRLPTVLGLTSSAEAVYEYDGGAVADVENTEKTFRVKVGYFW